MAHEAKMSRKGGRQSDLPPLYIRIYTRRVLMHKAILQHDTRDCGAACLSMVAHEFGTKLPLSRCRELTKTDRDGTNLYGIIDGAKKIGLTAEALKGTPQELHNEILSGKISFPLIAHITNQDGLLHFITIFNQKGSRLLVGDPAKGKYWLNFDTFAKLWTGYIIVFGISQNYQAVNLERGNLLKFFSYAKSERNKLFLILILSVAVAIIGIMSSFVFKVIIDRSETMTTASMEVAPDHSPEHGHDHDNLTYTSEIFHILEAERGYSTAKSISIIFLSLILLYGIKELLSLLRGLLISSAGKAVDTQLLFEYYSHLIELPVSSISIRNTGEYLSRFSDAAIIREAISTGTVTVVLDTVMAIGCGIVLFLESRALFPIGILMVILYGAVFFLFDKPIEKAARNSMEQDARLQSYFKENIDGISTIKASGSEASVKKKTQNKLHSYVQALFKESCINVSQESLVSLIQSIGVTLILWLGFINVFAGRLTLGTLLSFYALLAYFTEPTKNLISLQPVIRQAIVAADRLNDIFTLTTESASNCPITLDSMSAWRFENIKFRYGNRNLILDDISFSFKKGDKIGIIGASGCGKSTLAKLIMKYYLPTEGTIFVNDISLEKIDYTTIRKKISYVEQDTFLFSDTIINNLKLGNESATDQEIFEACRRCDADQFIRSLPFGYDTVLDENGVNLSGGQRQRLSLARAILKKPDLLILDESTSNLDLITEQKIKGTIEELSKDMACIIIAHRLSTIIDCDNILVMENGKIAESGTHEKLLSQKGLYYNSWKKQ